MSEHTQGKLRLSTQYADAELRDDAGVLVAVVSLRGRASDARRLAAAWNACQGIPTEVLEAQQSGGLPWSVADQIEARVTQAALVAALQESVEDSQEVVNVYVATLGEQYRPARLAALRETVSRGRAAIARATGGKTPPAENQAAVDSIIRGQIRRAAP